MRLLVICIQVALGFQIPLNPEEYLSAWNRIGNDNLKRSVQQTVSYDRPKDFSQIYDDPRYRFK